MNLEDIRAELANLPDEVLSKPDTLFPVVLDYYQSSRIEGTSLEDDGDMLLFQWGSFDWGQGQWFEVDLTRQAIEADAEDGSIQQLRCTFRYESGDFSDIEAGNRWCYSPNEVEDFRLFVIGSATVRRASELTHTSLEIQIENAE